MASRFYELPRETKTGSKNRRVREIGGTITLVDWGGETTSRFELSGGSKNWGFEKSGFHCIACSAVVNFNLYASARLVWFYSKPSSVLFIVWHWLTGTDPTSFPEPTCLLVSERTNPHWFYLWTPFLSQSMHAPWNRKSQNLGLLKWIIPELRVLALTKRHVGSGNEIGTDPIMSSFMRIFLSC